LRPRSQGTKKKENKRSQQAEGRAARVESDHAARVFGGAGAERVGSKEKRMGEKCGGQVTRKVGKTNKNSSTSLEGKYTEAQKRTQPVSVHLKSNLTPLEWGEWKGGVGVKKRGSASRNLFRVAGIRRKWQRGAKESSINRVVTTVFSGEGRLSWRQKKKEKKEKRKRNSERGDQSRLRMGKKKNQL